MSSTNRPQDQDAALEHFVCTPVTEDMIAYLADMAQAVIQCETFPTTEQVQLQQVPTPPTTPPPASTAADLKIPSLEQFITSLVIHSNVQVPTLMTTLLYLHRLKKKLPPVAKGLRCTTHRIFLACLILSAKFLNDSSPKNKHWAGYTSVPSTSYQDFSLFGFSRNEVNLMERQLLYLLDWDLNFDLAELEGHFEPFLAPIRNAIQEERQIKIRHREYLAKREAERHTLRIARPAVDESKETSEPTVAQPRAMYNSAKAYKAEFLKRRTPSASDIPDLSRSCTTDTTGSYNMGCYSGYSSRESSRSRSNTPISRIPSMNSFQEDLKVDMYASHDEYYLPVAPTMSPEQVYIAAPTHGKVQPDITTMYDIEQATQQSSRRARMGMSMSMGMGRSQNIISRFLGSRN
ncbi:hypothetical protein V494_01846 [Pseudogymnoascus sp. VKM F-4513 (FW-928)]|nr:hypothetical protein V494_01846 [Pseudogymnoascus sp. VKM F-4513 (FW-928)]